jgi:hypothetical protein
MVNKFTVTVGLVLWSAVYYLLMSPAVESTLHAVAGY